MMNAMLETVLIAQLGLALGVSLVMALRVPVRHWFGARLAFSLWLLPLLLAIALIAPGPFKSEPVLPRDEARVMEEVAPATPAEAVSTPAPNLIEQRSGSQSDRMDPTTFIAVVPHPVWILVWFLGALATALVLGLRQARYYQALRPMRPAPELGEGVYRAGSSSIGASLVGVAKPKIIVPADFETRFEPAERHLIVEHEREHRRAGHAQFNALAALLQAVCWMNPLVHLAQRWFRLDQELACDAAILARTGNSPRTYGAALLRAQTDIAAPFGCTWRAANGLKTRIGALSQPLPAAARRLLGIAVLTGLGLGLAAASWAARPEVQAEPTSSGPVTASSLDRVQLRGIDARLTIIAEPRRDIVLEGYPAPVTTRRRGRTQLITFSDASTEVCRTQGSPTHEATLRVPEGVALDMEGRMQAELIMAGDVDVRAEGCGTIALAQSVRNLTLDLGQSVLVRGEQVRQGLIVQAWGGPRVELEDVGGELDARVGGGTVIQVEALGAGGRASLSGGSVLRVEEWTGPLDVSVSGSSETRIDQITGPYADFTISGASKGWVDAGYLDEIRIDQAARGEFYYGGTARQSLVRNRGEEPVILANPGAIDREGLFQTSLDPPAD